VTAAGLIFKNVQERTPSQVSPEQCIILYVHFIPLVLLVVLLGGVLDFQLCSLFYGL